MPLNQETVFTDSKGSEFIVPQHVIDELEKYHNIDAVAEIRAAIEKDKIYLQSLKDNNNG